MIGTRALGRPDEDHAKGAMAASHTGVRPPISWRRSADDPAVEIDQLQDQFDAGFIVALSSANALTMESASPGAAI
jgi:hypothetical protein